MIRIDRALLAEVGLSRLPANLAGLTLRAFVETLETRVGRRFALDMSDEEKDEFEEFEMRGDDAGALMWLEQRYPDYRSIVREEYTIVLTRLAASAGWMGSVIDLPS